MCTGIAIVLHVRLPISSKDVLTAAVPSWEVEKSSTSAPGTVTLVVSAGDEGGLITN